jgi:hypothetical protein
MFLYIFFSPQAIFWRRMQRTRPFAPQSKANQANYPTMFAKNNYGKSLSNLQKKHICNTVIFDRQIKALLSPKIPWQDITTYGEN